MSRHDDDHCDGETRFRVGNFTSGDIALFKDIAEAAADNAVQKMFVVMGHDPKEPLTAQLDAAWTRRMRTRSEGMIGKAAITAVGLAVVGAAHAIWTGVKTALVHTATLPPQ